MPWINIESGTIEWSMNYVTVHCRCGETFEPPEDWLGPGIEILVCEKCGRKYDLYVIPQMETEGEPTSGG